MRLTITLLLLGLCLVGLLALPGCNTEQIAALKLKLVEARGVLETAKTEAVEIEAAMLELDELIADLPPGGSKDRAIRERQRLTEGLVVATGVIDKLAEQADVLLLRLETAENEWDVADATVQTAAPLLPAPIRSWLLLGWGVIATIRAAANRRAGVQIAKSVEPATRGKPFDPDEARSVQGRLAGRIVDEAQGKKLRLPL